MILAPGRELTPALEEEAARRYADLSHQLRAHVRAPAPPGPSCFGGGGGQGACCVAALQYGAPRARRAGSAGACRARRAARGLGTLARRCDGATRPARPLAPASPRPQARPAAGVPSEAVEVGSLVPKDVWAANPGLRKPSHLVREEREAKARRKARDEQARRKRRWQRKPRRRGGRGSGDGGSSGSGGGGASASDGGGGESGGESSSSGGGSSGERPLNMPPASSNVSAWRCLGCGGRGVQKPLWRA
jgi:hypothetical protein